MKYTLFLILAFIVSTLFSPISFGIELSKLIEMPEYKSEVVTILPAGDQINIDYASINASIRFNLDNSSFSPSQLAKSYMINPWMKAGNRNFVDYKEVATLTSKAELVGGSLNMMYNKYTARIFI